jgi:hypothetical protein
MAVRGKEPEETTKIFQRSCVCKHATDGTSLQTNSIISCLCLYVEQDNVQYMTHLDFNPHFREQLAQFLCCGGIPNETTDALVIITSQTHHLLLEHTLSELQKQKFPYGIFSGRWPLHVAIAPGRRLMVLDKQFVHFEKPKEAAGPFGLELLSRPYLQCAYRERD